MRKFKRDALRRKVGNRNLKEVWRQYQQRKYNKDNGIASYKH